jgi:hypothetical protein
MAIDIVSKGSVITAFIKGVLQSLFFPSMFPFHTLDAFRQILRDEGGLWGIYFPDFYRRYWTRHYEEDIYGRVFKYRIEP